MIKRYKNIGIYGLGVTGLSLVEFFISSISVEYKNLFVWDDCRNVRKNFLNRYRSHQNINLNPPRDDNSWKALDVIFISPGIAPSSLIFAFAKENNIDLMVDIDLFFLLNKKSKFIGVTGTNGKTTCCDMIYHILKDSDIDVQLGGNIGNPVMSLPFDADIYVFELSSYQLDLIKYFRADIALLTGISKDHIEHHGSFESYLRAKKNIFTGPISKIQCVLGDRDSYSKEIARSLVELDYKTHIIDKVAKIDYPKSLLGIHNKYNMSFAYKVCTLLGLSHKQIQKSVLSYKCLPHRIEFIGQIAGVKFYNDSKATNPDAAASALASFDNIFWLAGGQLKHDNLEEIIPFLGKVKIAYLFGRDREKIRGFLESNNKKRSEIKLFENMKDAFSSALGNSSNILGEKNNIILLSPACASFDQYKNYKERGDEFRRLYEAERAKI